MQTQQTQNKKKAQRKFLLSQRRSLSVKERKLYSDKIVQTIINSPEYKRAKICFLFASMPDEVQTKELILNAFKAGKRVCLPYITSVSDKTMEASEIYSLDELVAGTYGILSVPKDKVRVVDPKAIDFVLVPAVGFDKAGYRLGMGGGYYDRYLARMDKAYLMAGIYACQLVDEIIKDEYDAQIDAIITENEFIRCK